jgi:hypothetical protein
MNFKGRTPQAPPSSMHKTPTLAVGGWILVLSKVPHVSSAADRGTARLIVSWHFSTVRTLPSSSVEEGQRLQ